MTGRSGAGSGKDRNSRSSADSLDEAGDQTPDEAVRQVLAEDHRDLLNFLKRRLHEPADAEEVLQRFILRALERSGDLRDVRSVRGWLSRVLASTVVDHQRRTAGLRRREIAMAMQNEDAFAVEPDNELDQLICACLYKLLPTLRPDYAQVIWRIDLLEEKRERVAANLGITVNNLTVRTHRARMALRTRLEELCVTCPVHGFLDCRCDYGRQMRQHRNGATWAPGCNGQTRLASIAGDASSAEPNTSDSPGQGTPSTAPRKGSGRLRKKRARTQ
jgi:RNA polymerase sigma-70 factor (ECF subfamily)